MWNTYGNGDFGGWAFCPAPGHGGGGSGPPPGFPGPHVTPRIQNLVGVTTVRCAHTRSFSGFRELSPLIPKPSKRGQKTRNSGYIKVVRNALSRRTPHRGITPQKGPQKDPLFDPLFGGSGDISNHLNWPTHPFGEKCGDPFSRIS